MNLRGLFHLHVLAIVCLIPSLDLAGQAKDSLTVRQVLALTYPERKTISVKLQGTERLPRASGEAKVERKRGITEIEVELDEMKPAYYFGGEIETYVLWTVSPEGHANNTGEFILSGNRSKLNVTTPLQTFGMLITAEPHFLVASPSQIVVLENIRPTSDAAYIGVARIEYRGHQGQYEHLRETLADAPETWREVRTYIRQAHEAVMLAERAGAREFAPVELTRAREALDRARTADNAKAKRDRVEYLARDAVRLGFQAQKLTEERSFQAALDAERKTRADQAASLQQAINEAQSEVERARLLAEQRQLEAEIEARARAEAQHRAEMAEQAAQEARGRLQSALGKVAETRQTARGLIVSLPDILFAFNKASLRPEAREIVSRIAGILLVTQGIEISIEGHTDSIGTQEYNQRLSEQRAQTVWNYLAGAGVPRQLMTARGFGEEHPLASNATSQGRQQNRRVEILITEVASYNTRE